MNTNNKTDIGIISTDLLSNEVICIHTDGSVVIISNDEVGNVEHGVEMTVQNEESPKVFSFEECKAAAEQCEHVGEFILKFTDEYDCAYKNDWLKKLFQKKSVPCGFWNEWTIRYVARRCKTKKEFYNRYLGAAERARVLGMLDTFDWFIPACGYYTKEMVFEISHKYTRVIDWMNNKEDSRFYGYAKDNGWLNEMTWVKRTHSVNGEWDDYEKCLAASKECKNKSEFSKKYKTAHKYSKENGWIDEFFPLKRKTNLCVYDIRAYEYELNGSREVYIYYYFQGMTDKTMRRFKNYCIANNLDIDLKSYKILATGLTRINKIKPFIEFMNQYEKDGWNIAIKPFYVQKEYKDKYWKFDKDEIIRKAKTCKTILEFRTKYPYDYKHVDVNVLREICPWLYEKTISYTIDELKEIISKYDSRSDLSKNNRHIYNYLKNNNLLDELLPKRVKNEEYWLVRKDEIIELSKQFKSVKEFKNAQPSEYNASKKYGFYNELQIQREKNTRLLARL